MDVAGSFINLCVGQANCKLDHSNFIKLNSFTGKFFRGEMFLLPNPLRVDLDSADHPGALVFEKDDPVGAMMAGCADVSHDPTTNQLIPVA